MIHVEPGLMTINIKGQHLNKVSAFQYFGSWLAANGETERELQARQMNTEQVWHKTSGLIYAKQMPGLFMGQLYKTILRPALWYGSESWTIKERHLR